MCTHMLTHIPQGKAKIRNGCLLQMDLCMRIIASVGLNLSSREDICLAQAQGHFS